MKTRLITTALAGALAITSAHAQHYPPRFMGGEATLTTAPNGAVVYDKAKWCAAALGSSVTMAM